MNFMWVVWIGFSLELLTLIILKPFIVDFESIGLISISIHVLFTFLILLSINSKIRIIFVGAFFVRVVFMFVDTYGKTFINLPHSGGDSVGFMFTALRISNDISLLSGDIYGGFYTKIIGTVFYGIGPQTLVGHYINVLLGLSIIYIIYKILLLLEIHPKIIKLIIIIAAFFPTSIIMSAIFLREILITFFVVNSLYFFIKWFKVGRYLDMSLSILMLGIASLFHSGVIGIFVGYSFVFLFYQIDKKVYRFSVKTVFIFIIIAAITVLVFTQYEDVLLGKFKNVEDISDIYSTASDSRGGSAYLQGMTINSPVELIIYGPIKAFYFLTAPLPMNWRGFTDVLSFFIDSMLYLGTILYFILNRKKLKDRKTLVLGLVIIIFSVTLIFGIGVGNAGTAMRHRQKIIPLILLLLAVMMDGKRQIRKNSRKKKSI